jgi:hypothetical protein
MDSDIRVVMGALRITKLLVKFMVVGSILIRFLVNRERWCSAWPWVRFF